MPTFIAVGYGDRTGYDRTDPSHRDAAHRHDEHLRERGALMGIAGTPVQVRAHDQGRAVTSDGPYLRSALPVAGFTVLDAATLDEAVDLASRTPCAVAHGVVEVWPLQSTT